MENAIEKRTLAQLKAEKRDLIAKAKGIAAIGEERTLTVEERDNLDHVMGVIGNHEERISTLEKASAMDDEPDGDEDNKKEDEQPEAETKSAVGKGRKTSLPQSMRDGRDYMSYANKREYRGSRLIDAVLSHRQLDGVEAEVSQEIAVRSRKQPLGYYMPFNLRELNESREAMERRSDFTTTTSAGSVYSSWGPLIELLRPVLVTARIGVRYLSGLEGHLVLPRLDSPSTVEVVAEEGSATASSPDVGSITLTPRTLSANVAISRRLMLNSSVDSNALVMEDLAKQIAVKLDNEFFLGSGSGQEAFGVFYDTANTNVITTGGSALTYNQAIEMVGLVKSANVPMDNTCYFLTSPMGEVKLKTTPRIGSTFPVFVQTDENTVAGYPVETTSNIPNNFSISGVGSTFTAVAFAAWSQFLICQWGSGLDIISDPYSLSTAGSTRITALMDYSHAARHPLACAFTLGQPTT